MLSSYDISDLLQFSDKMENCSEKILLNTLLFEYQQYRNCGTIEECMERKAWFSLSMDDIRYKFNQLAKVAKEEIEAIRLEQSIKPKKRGKPRKEQ